MEEGLRKGMERWRDGGIGKGWRDGGMENGWKETIVAIRCKRGNNRRLERRRKEKQIFEDLRKEGRRGEETK